jgi:class 3 adenylate cyclase/TolB-like protein
MAEEHVTRKLAAIFYADVAGYSRLMRVDELGTHRQLSVSLDLMADRIRNAGGQVVHYAGDAVLASFNSVVAATNCAIGIQRAISARCAEIPEDRRLLYRIGINLGEVIVDRDDIYGDGVNLAARLEGMADPGGICVSAVVKDQAGDKIDAEFEDLGDQVLKNIDRPVQAYRVVMRPRNESASDPTSNVMTQLSAFSNLVAPATKEEADEEEVIRFSTDTPHSIMILPFKNLSGDPNQEALVDGFRLAIQSMLVKLSGLFLINVPVAETYRHRNVSAAQAGNEVGIRYVLHGAVQIVGDRLRITVQLTDAPAAQVVWAERYDRVLDDIFEIQDEVTTEVAIALNVSLEGGQSRMMWWENLPDRTTRELVLHGLSHLYKGTKHDNATARRMFEKVDELIPGGAKASGLIAFTYWADAFRFGSEDDARSIKNAAKSAEKAIALGDPDGFGHTVLARLRLLEHRHDEALALAEEATTRRVCCPLANAVHGDVLRYYGRPNQAIKEVKKSVRYARFYAPWMANVLAASYRDLGEFKPSLSIAREALRLDPENVDGLVILCTDYILAKSNRDARQIAEKILEIDPSFSIQRYVNKQPYRNDAVLKDIATSLREAGLPN